MRKRKQGTLRSGRSKKKVTSRKQAIAIGLSEARQKGKKVPKKKSSREEELAEAQIVGWVHKRVYARLRRASGASVTAAENLPSSARRGPSAEWPHSPGKGCATHRGNWIHGGPVGYGAPADRLSHMWTAPGLQEGEQRLRRTIAIICTVC